MTSAGDTIWDLVRQASETLPEPFSRAALITWISKRRPDVELTSISTHIQYAVAEAPNRDSHYLGTRPPLLSRVDRGLYRRYRPVVPSSPKAAGPRSAGDQPRALSPPRPSRPPARAEKRQRARAPVKPPLS